MRCVGVLLVFLAAVAVASNPNMCLGCTLVVGITDQVAQVHNETVDKSMERLCGYLPEVMKAPCKELIDKYGGDIVKLLEQKETPDRVCQAIDLCQKEYHQCHLFPVPTHAASVSVEQLKAQLQGPSVALAALRFAETPWQWIMNQINRVFNYHKPLDDFDRDMFGGGEEFALRGTAWRGKDCHNDMKDVYPGRRTTKHPASVDHNCNGIYGSDAHGVPYEDLFCNGTKHLGIAILGDSVGAHFHIPPAWIDATAINDTTFKNAVEILENELDWPQMSTTTGYMSSPWIGHPEGPVSSLYLKFRERNRCVHRDFQNIAVNGARSSAMADDIMFSFARNVTDHPILMSYALVGNDVCNGHPGMSHMTEPAEFRSNVLKTLTYLDRWVPAGSHLTFTGIIDGRTIWNTLAHRWHPIGQLNKNVNYIDFWSWLNCMESNPCLGWMNTNETLRNLTTGRANELNQVYVDLVANTTWRNFDIRYFENPLYPVLDMWRAQGGQDYQLFEPIIGMHPTQQANYLLAEYFAGVLAKQYPDLMPGINPHNDDIAKLFGDQGGY